MEEQVNDIDRHISEIESENSALRDKNNEINTAMVSSNFAGNDPSNEIRYQLDCAELLARIEHFLKGEVMSFDDDQNEYWSKQTNEDLVLFNEYGVNAIMSIIGNYIDKNTMLSRYDEMRINEILADLGDELIKFIFCNFEKMGMDTEFKKTRYELTVLTIIHGIESTYRKAIQGKTSEEINTSRIFTQSDSLGRMPQQMMPQKQGFSVFNPSTWRF